MKISNIKKKTRKAVGVNLNAKALREMCDRGMTIGDFKKKYYSKGGQK